MDEHKMRAMIAALRLDTLESLLHDEPTGNEADAVSAWFDMLRKQAIVIEARIIQEAHLVTLAPYTEVHLSIDSLDEYSESYILLPDHPLTEGKALVMILPLEDKNE